MGRSTPVRQLSCSKCRARDGVRVSFERARTGAGFPTWFNVVAVARVGSGVQCRCRSCGHEYVSQSCAARHAMLAVERQKARALAQNGSEDKAGVKGE